MRETTRLLWHVPLTIVLMVQVAIASDSQPVEIRVPIEDRMQLERLSEMVDIINFRNGEAAVIVSPDQMERLRDTGFVWRAVEKRAVAAEEMCPIGWQNDPERSWSCYPTYSQYVALMEGFAAAYPHLCRLENLGPTSNQVRPHDLWAVRISANPDHEEPEPEVLLTSTMHGDEAGGFVLLLRLINELLEGYGDDSQITNLADSFEIWINPNANPDGTFFTSDDTVDGAIRYYVDGSGGNSTVNANRNFPDPREGDHPDGNSWWAETAAMMAFADAHTTTLSANFHDGAELVNYPWDTWERRHVDDDFLVQLSRGYADLAQDDSPPGYMTGQSNGITNGWDWYPIAGGRQDFMTYWHSDREVTIELSRTKTPPADQLEGLWDWNRRALLDFIARASEGIHGLVTGPGGEPLAATIELVGHDSNDDNSFVATDPDVGDYHRLVLPGSYTVKFSADGHDVSVVDDVVVISDAPTNLNVVLQPTLVNITGRVTTPASLLPIVGATVELVGTTHTTVTSTDGIFSLTRVPAGSYTIRVRAAHFATVEKAVSVTHAETTLDVVLPPLSYRRVTVMVPEE